MSALTGDLAKAIGRAFSRGGMRFLPATRYRPAQSYTTGGNVVASAPIERACLAIVGACNERMRGSDGFTEESVGVYVLGTSLNARQGTMADLTSDDEIVIHAGAYAGQRWALSAIALDAAGALFEAVGAKA